MNRREMMASACAGVMAPITTGPEQPPEYGWKIPNPPKLAKMNPEKADQRYMIVTGRDAWGKRVTERLPVTNSEFRRYT